MPKMHFWVLAPNYPQARQGWGELKAFIPPELIIRSPEDEKLVELVGGCLIEVKSADVPSSLQTVGLDFIWITEAASIPDEVWYSQVSPMLVSPGRLGRAFIEGRPRLPDCWFEKLFASDDSDIATFYFTTYDSPLIDKALIDKEKERIPEAVFAQEYLAITMAAEDSAFRGIEGCAKGELAEPTDTDSYVAGLDLGKKQDFSVMMVMRLKDRHIVYFKRMDYDWVRQEEVITEIAKRYRATVYMDSTGLGDPIYEQLRSRGVLARPVVMSSATKQHMMDKLAVALAKEVISFPAIPELLRELRRYKRVPSVRWDKFSAPSGEHDDCVVSLALAVWGVDIRDSGIASVLRPRRYGPPPITNIYDTKLTLPKVAAII